MDWNQLHVGQTGTGCLRVVYNHVVELDSSEFVFLRDAAERIKKEAITQLHDIRFVHTGDFL